MRVLCGLLGTLLMVEVPAALAQNPITVPTSWGALKREAKNAGPVVDPELDGASVRAALKWVRRLRPAVTPKLLHAVPLESGMAVAVTGPAGPDKWVTHIVTAQGRAVGSTVFDFGRGVIRDPQGNRIVWRAPTGDLEKDLLRVHETKGIGPMLAAMTFSLCQNLLTGPIGNRCLLASLTGPHSVLACIGIILALTALCFLMAHVSMPPDPNQETGSHHRPNNPKP